ncbi:hypothetical protein BJX66DRAFT_345758 [Aspergillus keveii]|uniref:Cyclin n=1 Tax=Aspergillus keveii TaxID=714993 RepID=A0ABR4FHG2_9EURO
MTTASHDSTYKNHDWSHMTVVDLNALNALELDFLQVLDWRLSVSSNQWKAWLVTESCIRRWLAVADQQAYLAAAGTGAFPVSHNHTGLARLRGQRMLCGSLNPGVGVPPTFRIRHMLPGYGVSAPHPW